ncbi:MAG: Gfo/Idh/MocA family protein [Pirellulales bacterium]
MDARKVRIGVVGLGGWGKNVVRSFSAAKNCQLAYVCDASQKTLAHHRQLYPQATATDSYEQLLADSTLDAIALVTPAPMHFDMAKAALNAGKHVYVEKPMTLTESHARQLVQLADESGQKLMVGHLLEYHPAIDRIKQEIDSGSLGDIQYMYCSRLNLGVVRQHENAFWSLAPHDISVVMYLFGAEPDGVYARGECYLQPGVEDVVFVNLHFADRRMAQIHVSWLDPQKERKMVVVGSKKMLVFDDMQPSEKVRIYDKGTQSQTPSGTAMQAIGVRHGDIHIPHISGGEPLDVETQHFINSIIHDTVPRSDGYDGLRVVRVLEQVERQLRQQPTIFPLAGFNKTHAA